MLGGNPQTIVIYSWLPNILNKGWTSVHTYVEVIIKIHIFLEPVCFIQ